MAARRPHIDLLSREDFSQRAVGKLLIWILTIGRYIVIFTELIVIAGFITRVILDRNLNFINETLVEQKAILASYNPVENRFRHVHEQLDSYSRIEAGRLDTSDLLGDMVKITPVDMRFDSLNIDNEGMTIAAVVLSPSGFSVFLKELQSIPEFSDLILESVTIGGPRDPSIKLGISAEFKSAVVTKPGPSRDSSEEIIP